MSEPASVSVSDIKIIEITPAQIEGYHAVLDMVARERKYLVMLQAFPLPETRDFVLNMIRQRNPHFVATVAGRVIGWCDITRHFFPAHAHRGSLGMGIMADYRGRGLGRRLVTAALEKARQEKFGRVELSVRADNAPAIALYEKTGFITEGVLRRGVCVDGRFIDTVAMAILLEDG